MKHIYVSFKTKVSPTCSLAAMKGKMDAYIEATDITAIGMCLDTHEVGSEGAPFEGIIGLVRSVCEEPVAVFAHNIEFHRLCWRKMGLPEPTDWCCTMAALKRKEPGEKKFAMAALCDRHGLPPRLSVDEMALNGKCPPELLRAAERDAALVRALAEFILGFPRTEIK